MNAVDEPPQGGILPDAADALSVGSQVEITFHDGCTVQGMVGVTQGATWAECSDGETILLSSPWAPPHGRGKCYCSKSTGTARLTPGTDRSQDFPSYA